MCILTIQCLSTVIPYHLQHGEYGTVQGKEWIISAY